MRKLIIVLALTLTVPVQAHEITTTIEACKLFMNPKWCDEFSKKNPLTFDCEVKAHLTNPTGWSMGGEKAQEFVQLSRIGCAKELLEKDAKIQKERNQ